MAIGVLLKNRAKRTSAARWPSSTSSPGERLSTSVREAPGLPVLAEGDAVIEPHRQELAVAAAQIEVEGLRAHVAGLAETDVIIATTLRGTTSARLSPPEPTCARS